MYYNRYKKFIANGTMKQVPNIVLIDKPTDKSKIWNAKTDRLDKISYDYYGHPYGDWLIMLVNGQYGSDEFSIPDGALIKIPYPYKDSLQQYIEAIDLYETKYGL